MRSIFYLLLFVILKIAEIKIPEEYNTYYILLFNMFFIVDILEVFYGNKNKKD